MAEKPQKNEKIEAANDAPPPKAPDADQVLEEIQKDYLIFVKKLKDLEQALVDTRAEVNVSMATFQNTKAIMESLKEPDSKED